MPAPAPVIKIRCGAFKARSNLGHQLRFCLNHQGGQLGANFVLTCFGAQIARHFAHDIIAARFFKIGSNHRCGVFGGVIPRFTHQFCGPKAQQLVAARFGAKLHISIMGEFGFKGVFAVVKAWHIVPFGFGCIAADMAWRGARCKGDGARFVRLLAQMRPVPYRQGSVSIGGLMARRKKIYEGGAKILYEGPEPGTLIAYFKDDSAPTPEQANPAAVDGKGVLNNRLSEFFMSGLHGIGMGTHFIRRVNMREQLVQMAEMIPLEIVVRNYAAGEMSTNLGIPEGTPLPGPIVEYYLKNPAIPHKPMVSEEHIMAFNWASQQDIDDIIRIALRVNDFLSGLMLAVGVRLADFRIEIGRVWEGDFMRLILADEISPDTCRLWDLRIPGERGGERGGDVRSVQMGEMPSPVDTTPVADVYTELARRLGVLPSNVTHQIKPSLIN